jgi:hypothetical protein
MFDPKRTELFEVNVPKLDPLDGLNGFAVNIASAELLPEYVLKELLVEVFSLVVVVLVVVLEPKKGKVCSNVRAEFCIVENDGKLKLGRLKVGIVNEGRENEGVQQLNKPKENGLHPPVENVFQLAENRLPEYEVVL